MWYLTLGGWVKCVRVGATMDKQVNFSHNSIPQPNTNPDPNCNLNINPHLQEITFFTPTSPYSRILPTHCNSGLAVTFVTLVTLILF